MKKFLVFIVLAAGIFYLVQGKYLSNQPDNEHISENGFVELPRLKNIKTDNVIIFFPKLCTAEASQRARNLADELESRNIPVTHSDTALFERFDPSMKSQVDAVMTGEIPIVIIDGWGKANPSLQEVIAEYKTVYE